MKKIMATVLLGLVGLILGVVLIAAFKPDQMRVSRTAVLDAPAAHVFAQVNSPRKMNEWNPFVKGDTSGALTYEGPAEGVGASNVWEGKKSGAGRGTIVESRPNQLVRMRMDFLKPFKDTKEVEFVLGEESGKTSLTWTIHGSVDLMGRVMHLFFDVDKMIGGSFERGFEDLKKQLEQKQAQAG